jgi:hypothetical protein
VKELLEAKNILANKTRHATTTSRSVSMILPSSTINPGCDFRSRW